MAWGICRNSGGMHAELLWTNPNPTTNMAETTLGIDLSGYDFFMADVNYHTTVVKTYRIIQPVKSGEPNCIAVPDTSGHLVGRRYTINAGSISIGVPPAVGYGNGYVIPLRIYGVKGKISGGV